VAQRTQFSEGVRECQFTGGQRLEVGSRKRDAVTQDWQLTTERCNLKADG